MLASAIVPGGGAVLGSVIRSGEKAAGKALLKKAGKEALEEVAEHTDEVAARSLVKQAEERAKKEAEKRAAKETENEAAGAVANTKLEANHSAGTASSLPDTGDAAPRGTHGGERAGKSFTKRGQNQILEENRAKNGGAVRCENCGVSTVQPQKSTAGVSPPTNEWQRDHIYPRVRGGDGAPSNGQILCRNCNRTKSDTLP
jgi:hypothetical protein